MSTIDKEDNYKLLLRFLQERESIRLKRLAGQSHPWTSDPILLKYKFTNISRKHDAFTMELGRMVKLWLELGKNRKDVLFNILVHRTHSRMDTLARWGWLSGATDTIDKLKRDKANKVTVFTGAFMCSHSEADFSASWKYMHQNRGKLLALAEKARTLKQVFKELKTYPLVGKFLAWQILSDLRLYGFVPVKPDNDNFVVLGPGAKKGIALMPERIDTPGVLLAAVKKDAGMFDWLDIEDVEHSLCEFFKYHLVYHDARKAPKQRYNMSVKSMALF